MGAITSRVCLLIGLCVALPRPAAAQQCNQTSAVERAECLTYWAIVNNDPAACNALESSNFRAACQQAVGWATGEAECGPIEYEYSRYRCQRQQDVGRQSYTFWHDQLRQQQLDLELQRQQLELNQSQADMMEQQLMEQMRQHELLLEQLETQRLLLELAEPWPEPQDDEDVEPAAADAEPPPEMPPELPPEP